MLERRREEDERPAHPLYVHATRGRQARGQWGTATDRLFCPFEPAVVRTCTGNRLDICVDVGRTSVESTLGAFER